MAPEGVLVIGETPSLGRSIVDLLEAYDVPTRYVTNVESEAPLSSLGQRYPVVIAACNESFCATARRWVRGELPKVSLVVVGSRDPILSTTPGVHHLSLPLLPGRLLSMIRGLLASVSGSPRTTPGVA